MLANVFSTCSSSDARLSTGKPFRYLTKPNVNQSSFHFFCSVVVSGAVDVTIIISLILNVFVRHSLRNNSRKKLFNL